VLSRIGQRLEQHAVDHAEYRGICSDAQRQCQYRHGRETRVSAQLSNPELNILAQVLEPAATALLAAVILHRLSPPELSQRSYFGLLEAHPAPHVLVGLHLDVRSHLLVDFNVELGSLKERADRCRDSSPPGHTNLLTRTATKKACRVSPGGLSLFREYRKRNPGSLDPTDPRGITGRGRRTSTGVP